METTRKVATLRQGHAPAVGRGRTTDALGLRAPRCLLCHPTEDGEGVTCRPACPHRHPQSSPPGEMPPTRGRPPGSSALGRQGCRVHPRSAPPVGGALTHRCWCSLLSTRGLKRKTQHALTPTNEEKALTASASTHDSKLFPAKSERCSQSTAGVIGPHTLSGQTPKAPSARAT